MQKNNFLSTDQFSKTWGTKVKSVCYCFTSAYGQSVLFVVTRIVVNALAPNVLNQNVLNVVTQNVLNVVTQIVSNRVALPFQLMLGITPMLENHNLFHRTRHTPPCFCPHFLQTRLKSMKAYSNDPILLMEQQHPLNGQCFP